MRIYLNESSTHNTISLFWTTPDVYPLDSPYYQISYSLLGDTDLTNQIVSFNETSFLITGLVPVSVYNITIRAFAQSGVLLAVGYMEVETPMQTSKKLLTSYSIGLMHFINA